MALKSNWNLFIIIIFRKKVLFSDILSENNYFKPAKVLNEFEWLILFSKEPF